MQGPKINHFKTVQLKGDVIVFIDQRSVDVSVSLDFLSDPWRIPRKLCKDSLNHGNLTTLTVVINSDISSTHLMYFPSERSGDTRLLREK